MSFMVLGLVLWDQMLFLLLERPHEFLRRTFYGLGLISHPVLLVALSTGLPLGSDYKRLGVSRPCAIFLHPRAF